MLEKVYEAFRDINFLTTKDLIQLGSIIKIKHLKKGEHFLKVGDFNYNAVKVMKGLLAHYIIDENGMQKILLFVPEKKNSGSLQTTLNQKPADESIIALEDSILLVCDIRNLVKLTSDNIRILKLVNESYKEIIIDAALRIKFLIEHNEEKRYQHFISTYPTLWQRIKQKDIASFLGITESSLSRIRARMATRKK